ncbi:MAG: EamA family transporter [Desulfobacteraceae bacterium]|jgi:drug/metabolite transporter (DMT)-like permease
MHGIAATIISIMPIRIIPSSALFFNEKMSLRAIMGAFMAVVGVALLFL